MWPGLIALLIAVLAAAAFALYRRRVDGRFRTTAAAVTAETSPAERLTEGDLGAPLGRSATVVQFSSEFCAPCRAAERVITDAVAGLDGVRYLDIDSETKLDLVRRLNILRTPTVVVTDDGGRIVARTAGVPTKQSLQAVLPAGAS
ncbi:thiol reductase thioredoxin [Microlunatus endophyticus]|uniref:Thiol reductase thioredoxin n=1 Tax=Microlunatus endophyticus TaxID=1716077 RepID=A0A917W5H6_9ACTN|nr:thioredoxin family protein [Microlunatus endophyticus]GGL65555.1 thiol reductase thioredoxin [Microlunatus endophyticus]